MKSVTGFIAALGPARLAAMGAVALGLIGFFVFLVLRFSQPQLGVLFTDLTFDDSVEIVKRLEALNVDHAVRQEGAIILVPEDRVLRLRMTLAEDGLPAGGVVGYEIFDKSDTLGATSFVQRINRLRAIEGELARTIRAIERVQSARVHLVLPERRLFARKNSEASASIVVRVRGGLDAGQIKSIQHLVASAVEDLKPGNVSIVDETGKLLASGQGDESSPHGAALDERSRAIEARLQARVAEIVASVVGDGRARVRVTAEIDYNKVTRTSDTFDPNGQVVRSTQSREETSAAATPTGTDSVSVGNELPAAGAERGTATQSERASKSEEVVNYEISKTTKTEIVEGGRIKRLSVAVLVDGLYQKSADGKLNYAPRSAEELEKISALVRSAVGFDKERGDQLHVANLRFADSEPGPVADQAEAGMFDLSKADYFHIAELTVIGLVSLLVLLFVVRPLVRRIVTPEGTRSLDDLALELTDEAPGQLPAPDAGGQNGGTQERKLLAAADGAGGEALKTAALAGEAEAGAIREVGEIVQNNPEEAVTIVRNWIQQTA